jgi:type III restriction enzyme
VHIWGRGDSHLPGRGGAKSGDAWIGNALAEQNAEHNNALPRVALKMATGSGKTVVMAMLIAWHTLNTVASRHLRPVRDPVVRGRLRLP